MKLSCRECGVKLNIAETSIICPKCGKETSWLSEPKLFGFD